MLFSSGTVADALKGTLSIGRARLVSSRTDHIFSLFILSGSPAGLAHIYERRASTVLSASFLVGFFLFHAAVQSKHGTGRYRPAVQAGRTLEMMTIDGSQHSGSGTIVRYAVALAALLRTPIRVVNAREHRAQPGLRPQHVASVRACAELCGGSTDGVQVGSREFTFMPGAQIVGGDFEWNIGTAGSTTMLALSLLPIACFASAPVRARTVGGVFQDFAPSPHHLQHVLAAMLRRLGAEIDVTVVRPGYVPGGSGVIEFAVTPSAGGLTAIVLPAPGTVQTVSGIALCSHLRGRRVADRMAAACQGVLEAAGVSGEIERVVDEDATQAGANLTIWAESSSGCRFGADCAGKLGRTSEAIGEFVAATFLEDVASGATVDRHLADQLVLFAALAHGRSTYVVPDVTDHVSSNIWLVGQFGANASIDGKTVAIEGIGLARQTAAGR
jgi:RNA 3'-terminal phosphate cyclase (ATP)